MAKEKRGAPQEFDFDADSSVVAERITGGRFETDTGISGRILDAKAFTRADNEGTLYAPIRESRPGVLIGLPFMQHANPLISTQAGSCIQLTALEIQGEEGVTVVRGAGRVARALGLQKHDMREVEVRDPMTPVIRIH